MKTCTTERRIMRARAHDPLAVVSELVDDMTLDPTVFATDDVPRYVFGARADAEGLDVFVHTIDTHPTHELTGFRAPDDWCCAGVATGAWASTYDDSVSRPTVTDVERRRVRLVHAVDRSGASMSIYRESGVDPVVQRHHDAAVERAGALDDTLRRVLGIATAPAGSTLEYFATRWVDDVFARAADGSLPRPTWKQVASLHEVHTYASASGDPRLRAWAVSHIVRAGELLAEARPWSTVREQAIEQFEQQERDPHRQGEEPERRPSGTAAAEAAAGLAVDEIATARASRLSSEIVRWMDDGIFSRSVMGRYPPIDDLLVDLHALLPPTVYVHLVDTIEAWGLLAS